MIRFGFFKPNSPSHVAHAYRFIPAKSRVAPLQFVRRATATVAESKEEAKHVGEVEVHLQDPQTAPKQGRGTVCFVAWWALTRKGVVR